MPRVQIWKSLDRLEQISDFDGGGSGGWEGEIGPSGVSKIPYSYKFSHVQIFTYRFENFRADLFSRTTKLSFFYEIIHFRCSALDQCLLFSAVSFQNTDTMYLLRNAGCNNTPPHKIVCFRPTP